VGRKIIVDLLDAILHGKKRASRRAILSLRETCIRIEKWASKYFLGDRKIRRMHPIQPSLPWSGRLRAQKNETLLLPVFGIDYLDNLAEFSRNGLPSYESAAVMHVQHDQQDNPPLTFKRLALCLTARPSSTNGLNTNYVLSLSFQLGLMGCTCPMASRSTSLLKGFIDLASARKSGKNLEQTLLYRSRPKQYHLGDVTPGAVLRACLELAKEGIDARQGLLKYHWDRSPTSYLSTEILSSYSHLMVGHRHPSHCLLQHM
jgi:hypothetical protein